MNREIKFRAYQKSKNYIYKVLDINFEGHNQTIREVKLSNGDIVTSNRIDDLVLMQYTGLKDKNGVEIYEFMEINGKYRIVYNFNRYVLQDISKNDISVEITKNGLYEITREYSPLS